jgi:transcriptional antiterminator RfaH
MLSETEACTDANNWYLIHCQSQKEPFAAAFLQEVYNLQTYLPIYTVSIRGRERTMLLFPNYLFVSTNLKETALSQINASPGVRYLVEFGGEPAITPNYVIEEIKRRLESADEFYQQPLKPGDHVRMKYIGPLQDLEMIFVGTTGPEKRVRVLLNILGRIKEVYMPRDVLEKIPDRQEYKRERYTRGKGRRIKSHSL